MPIHSPKAFRLGAALTLAVSTLAFGPSAQAQVTGSVPVQQFTPGEATTSGYNQLFDAQTLGHLNPGIGLTFNYAHQPLEVINRGTDESTYLVNSHLQADIMAALGIGEKLQLGLALPVSPFYTQGDASYVTPADVEGPGLGDLRLSALYHFLGDGSGLDLAAAGVLSLPTGADDRYLGSAGAIIEPKLIASMGLSEKLGVAANLGVNIRTQAQTLSVFDTDVITVGNELTYGLGGRFSAKEDLDLIAEFYGRLGVSAASRGDTSGSPLEFSVAARKRLAEGSQAVTIGAGTGLVAGYGTPKVRVFLGYAWPPTADVDTDGDGFMDRKDTCPDEAEDFDSFQDDDGCPDPDNDGDGVADGADACPDSMEDGLGSEKEDGCPVPDTDGDGLTDDKDDCPADPEDMDDFEDGDGCPDNDNDHDGLSDSEDQCPMEPETINGVEDDDGCPDEGESAVEVTDTQIRILSKVYFKTNSDVIQERSFNVLNQVASTLRANPEITKVEIQGHTDDVSAADYNRKLSERRAKSVKTYLIQRGVSVERLEAVGYGEDKPIKKGTSKSARAANRRVEFLILEVNGQPIEMGDSE